MGNRQHIRSTQHGHTYAGQEPAAPRVALLVMGGVASLMFLLGGVATYIAPYLTAPLYIAGSSVMLLNVAVSARPLRPGLRRGAADEVANRLPFIAGAGAIVLAAFWSGYLT